MMVQLLAELEPETPGTLLLPADGAHVQPSTLVGDAASTENLAE